MTGGEEFLPFKWEICKHCHGHGTSSRYLGAFTGSQLREDPDFAADYADGLYDRLCETCAGNGKIKVADLARLTPAKKKAYQAQLQDDADMRAIERQEHLMEGGWQDLETYGRDG